jgi:hypothetical protein
MLLSIATISSAEVLNKRTPLILINRYLDETSS